MFLGDYSQEVVFFVAGGVLVYMMRSILLDLPKETINSFVLAMIAIFLFRVVPGVGPATSWYFIDHLGFDAEFLGTLRIIAAVTSLGALLGLANSITSQSILKTMTILTVLATVLALPEILIYYDVHKMMGLSARSVIIADTALESPPRS